MATFTWTVTTAGGTTAWDTPSAWFDTATSSNQITSGFTTAPGADYEVNSSNLFTINNIGAGGTATPDVANSLTVSDLQATLLFADPGGALDIATTLSVSCLLNLGTVTGGSILSIGSSGAAGGTITLSAAGRIEGAFGDSIQNLGTSPTEISGSGTILVPANDGMFDIGTGVQVASTGAVNMKFSIAVNATLSFADAVGGGTVVFTANSGSGVLDVGDLSSFNPTGIENLNIGVGANTETTVMDFTNVGTSATATLSNKSTTGATLNVFANGTSHTIPLIGNFTTVVGEPGKFVNANYLSDGVDGTNIFLTDAPCFAAGTRILTPRGESPVEHIAVGDTVSAVSGVSRSVAWIGTGKVLATRGTRNAATPVIVRKGALADNIPHRDLRITKGHSLCLDGALIPIEKLINHRSILWDDRAQEVKIYHIELESHDVLLANGAPAESYRDDGNRWLFQNRKSGWHLPPQAPCAPILTGGAVVDAIWRRLLERSGVPLTSEPDLHLVVNGERVDVASWHDGVATFRLACWPQNVRIASRAAAPDQLGLARDPRELGVALRRIVLTQGRKLNRIDAEDERLRDGFYQFEPAEKIRWTTGDAALSAELFEGFDEPLQIELTVAHTAQYMAVDEAA
jgi:hypothetical protein